MLPHDLPPYSTVYYYFRRLLLRTTLRERQKTGVWQQMNNALRQQLRQVEGRNPQQACCDCAKRTSKADRRQSVGENDGKKGEV